MGQSAGEHREENEEESFATIDTALPFQPPIRAEIAPEDQDSTKSRMEFAPTKGRRTTPKNGCLGPE